MEKLLQGRGDYLITFARDEMTRDVLPCVRLEGETPKGIVPKELERF